MAKPKLVLYVDVVSPFAYFAFHILTVRLSLQHSKIVVFGVVFPSLHSQTNRLDCSLLQSSVDSSSITMAVRGVHNIIMEVLARVSLIRI